MQNNLLAKCNLIYTLICYLSISYYWYFIPINKVLISFFNIFLNSIISIYIISEINKIKNKNIFVSQYQKYNSIVI